MNMGCLPGFRNNLVILAWGFIKRQILHCFLFGKCLLGLFFLAHQIHKIIWIISHRCELRHWYSLTPVFHNLALSFTSSLTLTGSQARKWTPHGSSLSLYQELNFIHFFLPWRFIMGVTTFGYFMLLLISLTSY